MKKYLNLLFVLIIVLVGVSGCKKEEKKKEQLNLDKMREISELSTVKVIYHNVATYHKGVEKGIQHWFEKERDYWIEYNGWATIGINLSKLQFKIEKNNVTIIMPHAKILETGMDNYNKDSVYKTKDNWFNKNEITTENIKEAIQDAEKEMLVKIKNDSSLFVRAENNAKTSITNYINKIGELYNEKYVIEFKFIEE